MGIDTSHRRLAATLYILMTGCSGWIIALVSKTLSSIPFEAWQSKAKAAIVTLTLGCQTAPLPLLPSHRHYRQYTVRRVGLVVPADR